MNESQKIRDAKTPEDVFGALGDVEQLKGLNIQYKRISYNVHPDRSSEPDAVEVFKILNEWKAKAEFKIGKGTYGDRSALTESITLTSKTDTYIVDSKVGETALCDVYSGHNNSSRKVMLKVTRSPKNNDLTLNEAKLLTRFRTEPETNTLDTLTHVPELLDHFQIRDAGTRKQINVFSAPEGFISIQDVLNMYPEGIPVPDAAWMLNRLLGALTVVHEAGYVHAGIAPSSALVQPETHNGMLTDFVYAVPVGSIVKATSAELAQYIPSEIKNKKPVSVGTDLHMVSKLFYTLIGGEENLPRHPPHFRGLFRACQLHQYRLNRTVYDFYDDFNDVLKSVYGPRKFRKFNVVAAP